MSSKDELKTFRGRVRRNVVLSMSTSTVLSALAYQYFPLTLPPMPGVTDRLIYTLRWNALSVLLYFSMIVHIGNTRFFSAQINPLGTSEKEKVEVNVRVLQNTLEQLVASVSLQLVTSTWLAEGQMKMIPIVVTLFIVGRVLFWIGYLDPSYGHTNRAYGFPLSAYPSLIMGIFCSYKLVTANIYPQNW